MRDGADHTVDPRPETAGDSLVSLVTGGAENAARAVSLRSALAELSRAEPEAYTAALPKLLSGPKAEAVLVLLAEHTAAVAEPEHAEAAVRWLADRLRDTGRSGGQGHECHRSIPTPPVPVVEVRRDPPAPHPMATRKTIPTR